MVVLRTNFVQDAVSSSTRCATCQRQFRDPPKASFRAHHHTAKSHRARHIALPRPHVVCKSASAKLQSETELFLEKLEEENAEVSITASDLRSQLVQLESQVIMVDSNRLPYRPQSISL